MAKQNAVKAKWMIGLTGTALSAFVIGQVGTGETSESQINQSKLEITKSMTKQEQEYVQLDWSNYDINGITVSNTESGGVKASDRQTRRS
ncbi:hypothetical protein [Neobacillus dielmonensis]|uniref:hypothetical protein n=1 Tax=Neobacillus dielmonensis TaxID=1347369 RepID=UPI0005AB1BC5|nr:hypothetical protein [Neobacillus dielmonensis]